MPHLDVSALDSDPDGLGFLRAVIAAPADVAAPSPAPLSAGEPRREDFTATGSTLPILVALRSRSARPSRLAACGDI